MKIFLNKIKVLIENRFFKDVMISILAGMIFIILGTLFSLITSIEVSNNLLLIQWSIYMLFIFLSRLVVWVILIRNKQKLLSPRALLLLIVSSNILTTICSNDYDFNYTIFSAFLLAILAIYKEAKTLN